MCHTVTFSLFSVYAAFHQASFYSSLSYFPRETGIISGVPRLHPTESPCVFSTAAFLMMSDVSQCDYTQFHLQTDRKGQFSMVALRRSASDRREISQYSPQSLCDLIKPSAGDVPDCLSALTKGNNSRFIFCTVLVHRPLLLTAILSYVIPAQDRKDHKQT